MQAVEHDGELQLIGYAVLVGPAVSGKPVESLKENLRVQSGPHFAQDADLLLVGFVVPPVGRARRDSCLFSLAKATVLVVHLNTESAREDLEILLLIGMYVQRV